MEPISVLILAAFSAFIGFQSGRAVEHSENCEKHFSAKHCAAQEQKKSWFAK